MRALLLVASAAPVLLPAAPARTCECADQVDVEVPRIDGEEVPANAVLSVVHHRAPASLASLPALELIDDTGHLLAVDVSIVTSSDATVQFVLPQAALEVGATLALHVTPDGGDAVTRSFSVGPAIEEHPLAPTLDVEFVSTTQLFFDCGPNIFFWFSHSGDDMVLMDRDGESAFDPGTLSGTVTTVGPRETGGDCNGGFGDSPPGPGTSLQYRFAVVTRTGVFSGWSSPVTVTLPGDADGDGVDDLHDECPADPGPVLVIEPPATAFGGCPVIDGGTADAGTSGESKDPPPSSDTGCATSDPPLMAFLGFLLVCGRRWKQKAGDSKKMRAA